MPPGLDPRDAEIARLREENARIQAEAARLQASAAPAAAPPADMSGMSVGARARLRKQQQEAAAAAPPVAPPLQAPYAPPVAPPPTAAPATDGMTAGDASALRARRGRARRAGAARARPDHGRRLGLHGVHLREPEPERPRLRPLQHGAPGRGLTDGPSPRVRRACGARRLRRWYVDHHPSHGSCAPNHTCAREGPTPYETPRCDFDLNSACLASYCGCPTRRRRRPTPPKCCPPK